MVASAAMNLFNIIETVPQLSQQWWYQTQRQEQAKSLLQLRFQETNSQLISFMTC